MISVTAHRLTLEAEARFEQALGPLKVKDWGETGFDVHASALFTGRRRLEATPHNPGVAAIRRYLARKSNEFTTMEKAGYRVWVPGRYKRIPAEDGVIYYDGADLLEVNPDTSKRFADCNFDDEYRGRVDRNWLLMPCSGQVYGIIGSAVLACSSLDRQVVSNHVLRIAPGTEAKIRAGYLLTTLTHPDFGRPLVKALAFGSSVPELDPAEISELSVVRLTSGEENAIADLAEESAAERARADVLERELAADAGTLVDRFIAGDLASFATVRSVP